MTKPDRHSPRLGGGNPGGEFTLIDKINFCHRMLNQYTLTTPLTSVRGVGPTILKQASQAGINTVGDLVFDLPSRYVDRSQQAKIYQLTQDGTFTILAQVVSVTGQRYGRKTQQKAVVASFSGHNCCLMFFILITPFFCLHKLTCIQLFLNQVKVASFANSDGFDLG